MKKLEHHIFLIGFMGVGKSSTSRHLARKLGVKELDTDEYIVQKEKRSIPEIFEQEGEAYFRKVETSVLDEIKNMPPCIVSCGGGMAMREENVAKMKAQGTVFLLTASPETIYEHVKGNTNRPLLNGNMNVAYISRLMGERAPFYKKAADITMLTDKLVPWQVADRIIAKLPD